MAIPREMLDPSYVNPEWEELERTSPPIKGLDASTDIPALRAHLLSLKVSLTEANSASGSASSVSEKDMQIPMRDGATITVRVYRKQDSDPGPVFVMFHGGGFCLGGLDNEALLCRRWVTDFHGVAINVDYRLAPEHRFPIAVNDGFDALKWVAESMSLLRADPEKGFIVGGISAGATVSAVISLLYRDDNLSPPLTGLYLSVPSIFVPSVVHEKYKHRLLSHMQNAHAPILNQANVDLFHNLYKPDLKSPLSSPLNFSTGHKNLPPTYFQVCGRDPLRDGALIYEEILREGCGVKTKIDCYPGLPHGFWSWFARAKFSQAHFRDCLAGIAWLLRQGGREAIVNGT